MNKEERTKALINNIKLNINEQNVYEFGLCVEQWKQILDYIEQLQQENKILRENAENNDKVVDKANWENLKLKEHIEKYERYCKTTGIEELIKNKKYKEVFEKALDFIDCHFKEMVADEEAQELKSILKEVE